jgi:lysophospholipase L1-like esterase
MKLNLKISMKEKLKVFFMGFFTVVFLLEVGLRLIGHMHGRRAMHDQIFLNPPLKKQYTILCLGDSFTLGMGAPQDKDYSSQLENLLKSKIRGEIVKVINRGIAGQNTAELLNKLQYNIDTIKPNLIILLIGGANDWNYAGYEAYLKRTNPFSILRDKLYSIRIYKLVKLLKLNITTFNQQVQRYQ